MGFGGTIKKTGGFIPWVYASKKMLGGGGKDQSVPDADLSSLTQLRDTQQKQAKEFRGNMSGMQEDADRAGRVQGRSELARQLSANTSNFNQRGLLYGGGKGAADMGASANIATQLAGQSGDTRNTLENQARGFEDQAVQTGMSLRDMQQQAEDARFQQALSNREARMRGLGQLGGALGSIGGAMLGRKGGS